MDKLGKLAVGLCALLTVGCATSGQVDNVERTATSSERILKENESRLSNLENSINALNTQVAQLNNRVYEVRTKNGQRTSMTVVPVGSGAQSPAVAAAPQARAPQAATTAPAARRIDPSAKPTPLVAQTPAPKASAPKIAAPAAARPQNTTPSPEGQVVAGPNGQLAALPPEDAVALPPTEVNNAPDIPVPTGNTYSGNTISAHAQNQISPTDETVVPVPLIPANDLSLPPENSTLNLPPQNSAPASAPVAQSQQTSPSPAPRTVAANAQRGEEAAYQTALRAARAGHTAEGIRLFRDFLQKYPNGKYAANADYWIGECLYAQGKYQDALSQFQNINSSFPKHHKNADALLKAGMSLTKIGDSAGAQQKYRQLLAEFPNSEAAKRVRAMGIR